MSGLDRMIDPRSIAIAGLSADPTKHGRRVLRHLETMGYSGEVYGVNPGMPHVDGVVMVGSVDEIATPPDLVVSAVPASAVASVVLGCAGAGVVVVFAGGFGESGEEGRQREKHLRSVADRIGVRILGPNSGGIIRPDIGLTASFLTCLDRPVEQIRPGPVGLVTQSGGTGSYVHNLAAERGSGLAISISTGNEADVRLGEALSIVASLDAVRVVMVVLETVRDGPGFIDAVRRCIASGKPVVACRLGAGRLGQELMTTHTGALAAPTGVLAGVMDTLGVHVAETPGEAYEVAETVARLGRTGPRVGMVTHSGGLAILLSDLAERHELNLPTPSRGLVATLAPLLDQGAADNPLDMGGIIGGPSRFSDVIDVVASSGEYDVVLAVSSAHPPAHTASRVEDLLRLLPAVPVAHLWMAGDQGAAGLAELREAGAPVATDPRVAVRALSVAASRPLSFVERPPPIPGPVTNWGLQFVTTSGASSAGDAAEAADAIGYPVVVKIASPDVAHKTEIGGVILDLRRREHVIDAYLAIVANARSAGVDTADVRVEPFRPGLEVIVGGLFDDQLGALVSVGIGGIHTEILDDIAFAPAPVALESGRFDPQSTFDDPVSFTPPQTSSSISNFSGGTCAGGGQITLADALRVSCNTTFAQLGLDVSREMVGVTRGMGFNDRIPFDVQTEASTFDRADENNLPRRSLAGIGQGDVVTTPLQMALVAASIANGGETPRPRLVEEVTDAAGGIVARPAEETLGTAMSESTARTLTELMVAVVESGTGANAQIPGVEIAGKTGTAQSVEGASPHAWFIAFAPAQNPRIAVAVFVQNGGSFGAEATGGTVAAPMAQQIIETDRQVREW